MILERRYEPGLHKELGEVFQKIIEMTKKRNELMAKRVCIFAKRGRRRIGKVIDEDSATPTEFAQLILNLAKLYPKEFEVLPFLQPIRKKLEVLLGQKPSVVVPSEELKKRSLKLVG